MQAPFPIRFKKRPVKVAFLVNPKTLTPKGFASIFDFNSNHYNGRLNPIVFSNGKIISDDAWKFLEDFDPDVIKSTVKLENVLLKRIQDRLSPYHVQLHNPEELIGGVGDYPHINMPTDDLAKKATTYFGDTPTFVFFDTQNIESEKLKEFLKFNFGIYEHWYIEQMSRKVSNHTTYTADTVQNINVALSGIGESRKSFIFPLQLSSVPNHSDDVEYSSDNECFTVIVGDSPYDLAHYWNRSLSIPHWMRREVCHIWLPLEVAENEAVQEGLQLLIRYRASRTGNNNNGRFVLFESTSVPEDRLKKIADKLGEKAWCGKKVRSLKNKQVFPVVSRHKNFFRIGDGMDLHQAYSNDETVMINDYAFPDGVQAGAWMLDVYIQYRPEEFTHTNVRHWWRLPKRNSLTRLFFPYRSARIQSNGIPSVVMHNRSDFKQDESDLNIKIPTDEDVIQAYIFGHDRPRYTGDPRSAVVDETTWYTTQLSDKGRYLYGLIGLFSGISSSFYKLKEPIQREMFNDLAYANPKVDVEKRVVISNKLKKKLATTPSDQVSRAEQIDWLTDYTLTLAREHGKFTKEVDISYFYKVATDAAEASLLKQGKPKLSNKRRKELEKDAKRDVINLVKNKILLMGVRPSCTRCGYANWFHVDEIKQKLECRGCSGIFDLLPDISWRYKLNSLAVSSISQHGLIPVLLTLGELHHDARSSFIYAPSLDIFKRIGKGWKHLGDLDIACVVDGKFIMGEVKQTANLFKQSDFDKTLALARKIKPDKVLFSSLDDGTKRSLIIKNIESLKEKLKSQGTEVVWLKHQDFHVVY